jgi:hypothetical protein
MSPLTENRRGLSGPSFAGWRALLAAAFFAIPFIVAGSAYAGKDMKVYPGTMCHPENPSDPVRYDGNGGICNPSGNNDINVRCPVVRDAGTDSWLPGNVTVSGRSGNSDKPVSCTFRVMKKNGPDSGSALAAFFISLPKINATGGSQSSAFRIKSVENGTDKGPIIPDRGPMMLTCTLPRSTMRAQVPEGSPSDVKIVTSCITNYAVTELSE